MVNNTPTTSIVQLDGQASAPGEKSAADAAGSELDEPPIPRPPGCNDQEADTAISPASTTGADAEKAQGFVIGSLKGSGATTLIDEEDIVNEASWKGEAREAHVVPADVVATVLRTDVKNGLHDTEAKVRLERDGPNKLSGDGGVSIWKILVRQVSNSLTIVLLGAMALSYGTLDFIEGAVITAVILLNILLGFFQDLRAEKTMQSLLSLAAPMSKTLRNGSVSFIRAEDLVVGDIVQITTGDVVPADLRLFEATNLEVDEALLTGESLPTSKNASAVLIEKDISIGDRHNMAYSATTVTRGRGTGIVVSTGMGTEVGSVAELLRGSPSADTSKNPVIRFFQRFGRGVKAALGLVGTPLQVKLSKFAIFLFGLAVLLAIIVFSAAKWDLNGEVIIYGICVAVAVIPESLIAVMTITLAVGVKAMAKGHVVVRNMQSLEAIGGVTDICSDKTGTLTMGKMVVKRVWIPDMSEFEISDTESTVDPTSGIVHIGQKVIDPTTFSLDGDMKPMKKVLDAAALCNLATVTYTKGVDEKAKQGAWTAIGDPTEIALQVLATRFGRGKESLLETGDLSCITEHPFDSTLKRMSVAYRNSEDIAISVKGASEAILPALSITEAELAAIQTTLEAMSSQGLRVLCIATKTLPLADAPKVQDRAFVESNLKFSGLVGLYDPPRIETLGAVQKCHKAGIAVHMLTGDHLGTATAIASQVGILTPTNRVAGSVMKADDFDRLSDDEIDAMPALPVVLARCSPKTKVRMVEALHRKKAFCVMTGDGVNDAPALKRAHVGIAMGINGTDVAKDAADMVLTDDNFASIVKAVEEGRRLFDNIQKFLMHLLISNIAQVILLLLALAFKDASGASVFPLSPLEILWVNMITSSFLALGLGMEEATTDIMTRPPRTTGVFSAELIMDKMIYGTIAGGLCLGTFAIVTQNQFGTSCNQGWSDDCGPVFRARATVFAVLSFLLLVTAWEVKHFSRSLCNLDPARFGGNVLQRLARALTFNRFLLWAVIGGFLITFPVVYIPVVNEVVFKHHGITWEWGIVIAALAIYLTLVESWKAIKRRFGIYSGKVAVVPAGEV